MKNKYSDLIDQTFDFPQEEFKVIDNELYFNEVPMMDIIKQYGTPVKINFLPKISHQIQKAKRLFNVAMAKVDYQSDYQYCYCTKSSHFSFVLEEVLKNDVHLETSSAFDIPIIETLFEQGRLNRDRFIICNGFKRPLYTEFIIKLLNEGFGNLIPVLDNLFELDQYSEGLNPDVRIKVGMRIASEEEPRFDFYTSRLGIRTNDIIPYYMEKIKGNPRYDLKMLHFFINTGIKDTAYYWNELNKSVGIYCELKKICPELTALNIGGGFPIKNSLSFEYEYEYMAEEIVAQIKMQCDRNDVPEPDIFTEFGSFTVGESGAILFSIIDQKRQNDREMWNMIDSSFMNTLPDTWAINQKFILLAVNKWESEYERVFLGGLTCDSQDYYTNEGHSNAVFLPKVEGGEPLYIGMFHTGAYQDSISGYGGIQHCLIPGPKHVLVDLDENGEYYTKLFSKEQSYKSMLKILGY